ncbi:hypothetical protein PRSY57_1338700 [Plasmodium reichenowi]|uniref:Uncharacterized protein n=1 Tax=Plasmodium reichenowi TaxID=5854 RepID=A0A151L789_PLARE|nr:hypothetical protein PRSY57_1338700 [Plasmodium reichenowi]KYN94823.1 hypothetical protein PRSY57_1338700 [Plasmodium reichenowi]
MDPYESPSEVLNKKKQKSQKKGYSLIITSEEKNICSEEKNNKMENEKKLKFIDIFDEEHELGISNDVIINNNKINTNKELVINNYDKINDPRDINKQHYLINSSKENAPKEKCFFNISKRKGNKDHVHSFHHIHEKEKIHLDTPYNNNKNNVKDVIICDDKHMNSYNKDIISDDEENTPDDERNNIIYNNHYGDIDYYPYDMNYLQNKVLELKILLDASLEKEKTLCEEKRIIENNYNIVNKSIEEMKNEIINITNIHNEEIIKLRESYERRLDLLKQEIDEKDIFFKKKIETQEQENGTQIKKYEELYREEKKKKEDLENVMNTNMKEKEDVIKRLEKEKEDIIKKMQQQCEDKINTIQQQNEDTIKKMQEQNEDKINTIQQQNEDIIKKMQQQNEDKINTIQQQNEDTIKKMQEQNEDKINTIQQQNEDTIKKLQEQNEDIILTMNKEKEEESNQRINEYKNLIESYKKDKEKYCNSEKVWAHNMNESKEKINNLINTLKEYKEENKKLQNIINQKNDTITNIVNDILVVKNVYEDLIKEKDMNEIDKNNLIQKIKNHENDILSLQNNIDKLKKSNNNLNEDLRKKEKVIITLKNENMYLKKENEIFNNNFLSIKGEDKDTKFKIYSTDVTDSTNDQDDKTNENHKRDDTNHISDDNYIKHQQTNIVEEKKIIKKDLLNSKILKFGKYLNYNNIITEDDSSDHVEEKSTRNKDLSKKKKKDKDLKKYLKCEDISNDAKRNQNNDIDLIMEKKLYNGRTSKNTKEDIIKIENYKDNNDHNSDNNNDNNNDHNSDNNNDNNNNDHNNDNNNNNNNNNNDNHNGQYYMLCKVEEKKKVDPSYFSYCYSSYSYSSYPSHSSYSYSSYPSICSNEKNNNIVHININKKKKKKDEKGTMRRRHKSCNDYYKTRNDSNSHIKNSKNNINNINNINNLPLHSSSFSVSYSHTSSYNKHKNMNHIINEQSKKRNETLSTKQNKQIRNAEYKYDDKGSLNKINYKNEEKNIQFNFSNNIQQINEKDKVENKNIYLNQNIHRIKYKNHIDYVDNYMDSHQISHRNIKKENNSYNDNIQSHDIYRKELLSNKYLYDKNLYNYKKKYNIFSFSNNPIDEDNEIKKRITYNNKDNNNNDNKNHMSLLLRNEENINTQHPLNNIKKNILHENIKYVHHLDKNVLDINNVEDDETLEKIQFNGSLTRHKMREKSFHMDYEEKKENDFMNSDEQRYKNMKYYFSTILKKKPSYNKFNIQTNDDLDILSHENTNKLVGDAFEELKKKIKDEKGNKGFIISDYDMCRNEDCVDTISGTIKYNKDNNMNNMNSINSMNNKDNILTSQFSSSNVSDKDMNHFVHPDDTMNNEKKISNINSYMLKNYKKKSNMYGLFIINERLKSIYKNIENKRKSISNLPLYIPKVQGTKKCNNSFYLLRNEYINNEDIKEYNGILISKDNLPKNNMSINHLNNIPDKDKNTNVNINNYDKTIFKKDMENVMRKESMYKNIGSNYICTNKAHNNNNNNNNSNNNNNNNNSNSNNDNNTDSSPFYVYNKNNEEEKNFQIYEYIQNHNYIKNKQDIIISNDKYLENRTVCVDILEDNINKGNHEKIKDMEHKKLYKIYHENDMGKNKQIVTLNNGNDNNNTNNNILKKNHIYSNNINNNNNNNFYSEKDCSEENNMYSPNSNEKNNYKGDDNDIDLEYDEMLYKKYIQKLKINKINKYKEDKNTKNNNINEQDILQHNFDNFLLLYKNKKKKKKEMINLYSNKSNILENIKNEMTDEYRDINNDTFKEEIQWNEKKKKKQEDNTYTEKLKLLSNDYLDERNHISIKNKKDLQKKKNLIDYYNKETNDVDKKIFFKKIINSNDIIKKMMLENEKDHFLFNIKRV